MFLGDVFDKLLHAWSYRQHLPQHGLGILGQEQVGVIATNFLKLSHKLFVIFVWRKRRAIAAPAQAAFCAVQTAVGPTASDPAHVTYAAQASPVGRRLPSISSNVGTS